MNHKQYVPKAIAVCPKCKSKLALFHIIERRGTNNESAKHGSYNF